MIISDFYIYDFCQDKAGHFIFSPQANIIVSKDSKVGKSCLLKSLFYTLGLDLHNSFAQGWHLEELVFKVKYEHKGKKGYIIRSKNIFYVDDKSSPLDEKSYSRWLLQLLDLNIKLPTKNSDQLHTPYASAVLAPFYIDQDSSWKGVPYKNTVSSLQMYTPGTFPVKVFEGLFGILNEEQIHYEEEKARLITDKQKVDNKVKVLIDLRNTFIHSSIKTPSVDIKNIEKQLRLWLADTEALRQDIDKEKREIYQIQLAITHEEMDKEEMLQLLKATDHTFSNIEYRCTLCHSVLTREQSQQRLKLSGNKYGILQYLAKYQQKIEDKQHSLALHMENLEQLQAKYAAIKQNLESNKEWLNMQNIIEANAQYLLNEKYLEIAQNLRIEAASLANRIEGINKSLTKLKQSSQQLKEQLKTSFQTIISSLRDVFSDIKIDSIEFLKFKSIADSGTQLNQLFFSNYIAYSHLLIFYSKIKFVIGMDSPITTETSSDNLQKMYRIIEQYLLKTDNQTIVAMLEDKLVYLKGSYHLIKLSKPLLSSQDVDSIKKEFSCMFPQG